MTCPLSISQPSVQTESRLLREPTLSPRGQSLPHLEWDSGIVAPGGFWPEGMRPILLTAPPSLRWRNRGPAWAGPRARVLWGRLWGGLSPFMNTSLCSRDPPSTGGRFQQNWRVNCPRAHAGEGREGFSDPGHGPGPAPGAPQLSPARFSRPGARWAPTHLPRGQGTSPHLGMTSVHRLGRKGSSRGSGPSSYTRGQRGPQRAGGPGGLPARTPGALSPAFRLHIKCSLHNSVAPLSPELVPPFLFP